MTIKNLFKLRNLLGFSKKRDKIMTDRKDNLEKLREDVSVKKEGKYDLEIFKEIVLVLFPAEIVTNAVWLGRPFILEKTITYDKSISPADGQEFCHQA